MESDRSQQQAQSEAGKVTVTENSLQEALLQDILGPYLAELFDVPLPAPKDQPTTEPVADTDGQKLPWSLTLQPLLAAVPPQLAYTSVEAWPNVPSQTVPRYVSMMNLWLDFWTGPTNRSIVKNRG